MAPEAIRKRRSAARALAGAVLGAALALGGSVAATADDVPIGDQRYRPLTHYTPERNWMNDPNGMVLVDGTYHLFYQHNPDGTQWGNMSWGHATSTDLLHWQEQPLAIAQTFDDDGQAIEDIFSGSIVVDRTNSAGFGPAGSRPLVAIYTSAYTSRHPQLAGIQAQSLAYSLDDGRTWTKYDGNPVLDRGSDNFRDPKVFWYDGPAGAYWVMTAVEAVQHKVVLYKSSDLKSWTHLSDFGPANSTGGVWECPDLFELPVDGDPGNTKWVMVVNLNPGGVNGGSGGQYFVGDFDGVAFTSETTDAAAALPQGTVFAGFDTGTYEGWTVANEPGNWANGPWGTAPASGALDGQSEVTGFLGTGLVNGFLDHDWPIGTLESPTFTIEDDYINLLVGGGEHPHVAGTQLGNVPPAGLTLFDFDAPGTLAETGWQVTGDFATEPWRNPSSDGGDFMLGDRLLTTFAGGPRGDENVGSLTSPEFTIDGDHLSFLIGGGERTDGSLQAELLVDGQIVRTQTGRNDGAMDWVSWDVAAFDGRQARFRVLDNATGGWGSLAVDHIVVGDEPAQPRSTETSVNLIVDGQIVRSATGADSEHVDWVSWNVAEFAGRSAGIRIVDNNRGGWGHILVDQIMFSHAPARTALEGYDWLDWGRDYYAAVSYSGTPSGSRIMQGWMNNWDYANDIPTSTWRSSMSLPREVTLVSTPDGPRLHQRVVPQIEAQLDHAAAQTRTAVALDGAVDLGLAGEVVKIDAVLRPGAAAQAGITVLGDASAGTRIGYDTTTGRVFVDRRDSGDVGFNASFASIDDAPVALRPDGTIALELYVDRASVELFTDDGRLSITDQVFPNAGADVISAWATGQGAVLESITVTPLIPTMWKVPSAPSLEVEVTTSSRCMAGKVTVTAQARNADEVPVTVSLTTPHGARTLTVDDGKTVSAAFTTRASSIPTGEVQVVATARIDGQPVTVVSAAPIAARTC